MARPGERCGGLSKLNLEISERICTGIQHASSLRVGGFNRFAHSAGPRLVVEGGYQLGVEQGREAGGQGAGGRGAKNENPVRQILEVISQKQVANRAKNGNPDRQILGGIGSKTGGKK